MAINWKDVSAEMKKIERVHARGGFYDTKEGVEVLKLIAEARGQESPPTFAQIAAFFNDKRIPSPSGRPWSHSMVLTAYGHLE